VVLIKSSPEKLKMRLRLNLALFTCALLAAPLIGSAEDCKTDCCGVAKTTSPTTQPSNYIAFGDPTKLTDADNIDAAKVVATPELYNGKFVRMTGVVTDVCPQKGCWLQLNSTGASLPMFVKFTCPIDGFLIPLDSVGRPAIVEGVVTIKDITQDEARHIAEEKSLPKEEIEKIVGPQKQLSVAGPSALVSMPVKAAN